LNLLSVADLPLEDLERILKKADDFAPGVGDPTAIHREKTLALLFFEDSTRTRVSFERAAKRLKMEVMNFSVGGSSMSKGESLRDTVKTIEATGIDVVVMRHQASGAPWQVASWIKSSVINAGDGWHEHPTQALLDCYTIRKATGVIEGLHVVIVGDIKHSRVARSNVLALSRLGADVTIVAPYTLLPPNIDSWPVWVSQDLDVVIPKADVIYMLRMQRERQTASLVPSLREYTASYGLTAERAECLPENAVIMHPGPMNLGVEISADVADLPCSLITTQVKHGVAVRAALLHEIL